VILPLVDFFSVSFPTSSRFLLRRQDFPSEPFARGDWTATLPPLGPERITRLPWTFSGQSSDQGPFLPLFGLWCLKNLRAGPSPFFAAFPNSKYYF